MEVENEIKAINSKLDAVLNILRGSHDAAGKFTPGLSHRVDLVEVRVATLEKESERAEDGRLTMARGAGLALFGGVVSQLLGWVRDHAR